MLSIAEAEHDAEWTFGGRRFGEAVAQEMRRHWDRDFGEVTAWRA
jgi:hypothetical protein